MSFISAIEDVLIGSGLKPLGVVDQKHGNFDIVFPT